MVSLYETAHEIKKATGWSQERIGAETGLGLSTISRIFRVPGYGGNETSRTLLTQLHEKVVRPPFPKYLEKLFSRYEIWRERMTKKEFNEQLSTLEPLLRNHRALDAEPTLETCRLSWLLGHIHFHRAFYLKHDPVGAAVKALEWYQRALDTLDVLTDEKLMAQKYKVRQCIVSVQFNSCAHRHAWRKPRNKTLAQRDGLLIYRCVSH